MALINVVYSAGTITVTNGQVDISGVGTAWQLNNVVGAILLVNGTAAIVDIASAENSAKLKRPWSGPSAANVGYDMWLVSAEAETSLVQHSRIVEILTGIKNGQPANKNLTGLAALLSQAGRFPYFTDDQGRMDLAAITAAGRDLIGAADAAAQRNKLGAVSGPASSVAGRMAKFADASGKTLADAGYVPVQQGTGIGQSPNTLAFGWSPFGLKGTVDSTDLGKIWCDFAVGLTLSTRGSLRFPNKIVLQWARETNGVGNFNINYETAMSGTFAIAGVMDAEPSPGEMYTLGVAGVSGSGFSARPRYTAGGSAGVATQSFFWMAIGYIA